MNDWTPRSRWTAACLAGALLCACGAPATYLVEPDGKLAAGRAAPPPAGAPAATPAPADDHARFRFQVSPGSSGLADVQVACITVESERGKVDRCVSSALAFAADAKKPFPFGDFTLPLGPNRRVNVVVSLATAKGARLDQIEKGAAAAERLLTVIPATAPAHEGAKAALELGAALTGMATDRVYAFNFALAFAGPAEPGTIQAPRQGGTFVMTDLDPGTARRVRLDGNVLRGPKDAIVDARMLVVRAEIERLPESLFHPAVVMGADAGDRVTSTLETLLVRPEALQPGDVPVLRRFVAALNAARQDADAEALADAWAALRAWQAESCGAAGFPPASMPCAGAERLARRLLAVRPHLDDLHAALELGRTIPAAIQAQATAPAPAALAALRALADRVRTAELGVTQAAPAFTTARLDALRATLDTRIAELGEAIFADRLRAAATGPLQPVFERVTAAAVHAQQVPADIGLFRRDVLDQVARALVEAAQGLPRLPTVEGFAGLFLDRARVVANVGEALEVRGEALRVVQEDYLANALARARPYAEDVTVAQLVADARRVCETIPRAGEVEARRAELRRLLVALERQVELLRAVPTHAVALPPGPVPRS